MSLGISQVIVTPMQRLVLEISPATPAPLEYLVTLTGATVGDVVTETFTGEKWRSPGLYRNQDYTLTLTAIYADPEDNQVYEHETALNVSTLESMATILRQAVWDILFDGNISLDSRALYSLHDGYYRPVILRKSEVPDMPKPSVEVGMPVLRGTKFVSSSRKQEEWRLPMRLLDDVNKENADEFGRVWLLSEQVQAAVDLTESLNLGGRGVLDKAWSWRIMEDPDQERDRMSGLRIWLTVYVQRAIGAVGQ